MYHVIWSGSLQRDGQCGSLSSYTGPSQLAIGTPRRLTAMEKTEEVRLLHPKSKDAIHALVVAHLEAGTSLWRTMQETGATYRMVRATWIAMQEKREARLF